MATLFESYITGGNVHDYGYGANWAKQSFASSVHHKIYNVKLKLFRSGSPGNPPGSPGTLTVSIRATDVDGLPTGGDLCSGTTDGDTLTTDNDGEWREITFGSSYNLTANTEYAIILRALNGDNDNRICWMADSTGTYGEGAYAYSTDSGVGWTPDVSWDLLFEEWGVEVTGYRNRLMSLIGIGSPVPSVLPHPDNAIGTIDRSQLAWLYAGSILIYAAVESLTLHVDSLSLTLYDDLVDLTLATDSLEATLYDDTVALTLKDDSLDLTLWEK